jgi:lipopolysaccharide transport system ATP-binding protein
VSELAIRVERLGKEYRIGERQPYKSLRESITRAVSGRLRGDGRKPRETIWALRDVSFEVPRGEVIGIIGRNGAGKSTLLKILARITDPTEGRVEVHGRVGSLLEVGTGFHMELTGRENIYLNGAILGMKRAEIERKFDDIVAFAEIEQFLDTPVKHYSTGMYLRLAFAVAAHLEPEILLVDEVLAVGDAAFQKKCLGKMGDVATKGRTVLFVSHNMAAVQSLTSQCIQFRTGSVAALGRTSEVIEQYLADSGPAEPHHVPDVSFYRREKGSMPAIRFTGVGVNELGGPVPSLALGTPNFDVVMEIETSQSLRGANLTVIVKDSPGRNVAVMFSWDQGFRLTLSPGRHRVVAHVHHLSLAPGTYYADFGINQSVETTAFDVLHDVPLLRITGGEEALSWPGRPWGCIHPESIDWTVHHK